jgi:hypothetical protein
MDEILLDALPPEDFESDLPRPTVNGKPGTTAVVNKPDGTWGMLTVPENSRDEGVIQYSPEVPDHCDFVVADPAEIPVGFTGNVIVRRREGK